MKIDRVRFDTLKKGDRFALAEWHLRDTDGGLGLNMKVAPAVLCDDRVEHIPFNAVNLGDGRVRTFHDEELVYIEVP